MADRKSVRIVIVGAGASGIAAATRLLENGFDNVTILEAEDRIGGRIHSVEFGGRIVDIGAQWVHGEKGNIVYEMVKDLDLLAPSALPQDSGMSYFLADGSSPNKTITNQLFDIAMHVKNDKAAAAKTTGNFAEYFTTEYNKRVQEIMPITEEVIVLSGLILQWFKKFMVLLNSAETWDQLSTTSHYVFRPCEGDQLLGWKNAGYKTIIDVITKKIRNESDALPIGDKILLNKEVSLIKWRRNDTGTILIKCSDGSVFIADHVIVTMSVAVLKGTYQSTFVPALPDYKINSIENIPLGTVNKVLLKFPRKWWSDTIKDISFLWSEEERLDLLQEPFSGPIVNGRSWLENLFTFIAIDSHPNVLLAWINGPTAKLVELLSDETIVQGTMHMLRKFAGKSFDIPDPDGVLRSKWGSNPHFRGSYVHVNAKMEKSKASAEDLTQPLIVDDKSVVLFAGEATHATLFSTVNGAMETGYREAQRLIDLYER